MIYCKYCMSEMDDDSRFCARCGRDQSRAEPIHHLKAGSSLIGRYIVGSSLGEGGFGITYIGRDNLYDTKVAIKEYYPAGYANRDALASTVSYGSTTDRVDYFKSGKARFLREAKTLAKFSGEPGIVSVQNFFEANNTAYLVMELLEGYTLKAYLKKQGRLTPEQALELLMPVMESLKKVHAVGLIHRDISPDNIMITRKGVKLLDFGAARNVSAQANKSLSIMLKPGYAPEEQYRSRGEQGPWTDVYALCATIYKCITGKTPVDSTQRVFEDELKRPSELGIDVTPQFEDALMKGLAVFSRNRIQNIDELIKAFTKEPEEPEVPIVPEEPEETEAPGDSETQLMTENRNNAADSDEPKYEEDPGETVYQESSGYEEDPGETVYQESSGYEEDPGETIYQENPGYEVDPGYTEYQGDPDQIKINENLNEEKDETTSLALVIFGIIAAVGALILLLSLAM